MSETNTETVEETTKVGTFTKAEVETMIAEATKRANGEAATFRHKLSEIEEKENAEKIKNSQDLEELRTLLSKKDEMVTDLSGKLEGLNGKLETYHERDAKELDSLLPNVPENLREQVADESLPLDKRLSLARALSSTKQKPADYRGSGEPADKTIQDRLTEAIKNGDVMAQIAIKREMSAA